MGISSGDSFATSFLFIWHFYLGGSWKLWTNDAFCCMGAAVTTAMTYLIASMAEVVMKPQRLF